MMKHVVAIISCAVGALFGGLGAGGIGAAVGMITGYAVGYAYAVVVFSHRGPKILRFLVGSIGGTIAGGLSGVSVHVPALLGLGEPFWGGDRLSGIAVGGLFGLSVGTLLGIVIISIIFINELIEK